MKSKPEAKRDLGTYPISTSTGDIRAVNIGPDRRMNLDGTQGIIATVREITPEGKLVQTTMRESDALKMIEEGSPDHQKFAHELIQGLHDYVIEKKSGNISIPQPNLPTPTIALNTMPAISVAPAPAP